jgi:hypothetical protein
MEVLDADLEQIKNRFTVYSHSGSRGVIVGVVAVPAAAIATAGVEEGIVGVVTAVAAAVTVGQAEKNRR